MSKQEIRSGFWAYTIVEARFWYRFGNIAHKIRYFMLKHVPSVQGV